mmetsp:Transcript_10049/g.40588  ORF Transcript_10049/g.40588 Transcript_10049/m.40588 type:complete len:249 (-) Transcript_10049:402-1148(-)
MVRPNRIGAVLPSTLLSGGGSSEKQTTITVTLSHESLRSASSASSLAAADGSLCLRSASLVKSTALCELNTSHSPSHAMMTNSSSWVNACVSTSGVAISGPGSAPAFPLRPSMWKSPKALATPRCPLTYPSSTKPPAASMRDISVEQLGRWSVERSAARPRRDSTARQSPALATRSVPPLTHSASAVEPDASPSAPIDALKSSSVRWNASLIACAGSFANDGSEVILATSLSLRKSAHPLPPCPSNRQ